MNTSSNYSHALEKSNSQVNKLRASLITRQIVRDSLFGKYSSEGKYARAPIVSGLPIMSFITFLAKRNIIICRQNLLTMNFHLPFSETFRTTINPISLLRLIMSIKYYFYSKRHFRRLQNRKAALVEIDVDAHSVVKTLYVTFFCAQFINKFNKHIFYFSLGTPQYLRFFTEQANEVQHGIIHDYHPTAHPIARSRGHFYSCNQYLSLNFTLPIKLNAEEFEPRPIFSSSKLSNRPLYIEGWPKSSAAIERYLMGRHGDFDILRHPNNESLFNKIPTKKRAKIISEASQIYIGLTTLLIDLKDDPRLTVVLTDNDLHRINLPADNSLVVNFIYERYHVVVSRVYFIV